MTHWKQGAEKILEEYARTAPFNMPEALDALLELTRGLSPEKKELINKRLMFDSGYKIGWNECRAKMLKELSDG